MTQKSNSPNGPSIAKAAARAAAVVRADPAPFDPHDTGIDAESNSFLLPPQDGGPGRPWSWRYWWLIPLCTLLGAAGGFPRRAAPLPPAVQKFTSSALVKYASRTEVADASALRIAPEYLDLLRAQIETIADPEKCARAAREGNLSQALPWLRDQNLDDPRIQQMLSQRLRKIFKASLLTSSQLVRVEATTDDRNAAAVICNSFADVFVAECLAHAPKLPENQLDGIRAEMANSEKMTAALRAKRSKLLDQSDASDLDQQQDAARAQSEHYITLKQKIETTRVESQARLARLAEPAADGIVEQFLRLRQQRLEEQKTADKVYADALAEQLACEKEYATERGAGKTERHRDVILAADRLHRAQEAVARRTTELSAQVDSSIAAEKDAAIGSAKVQASESIKSIDQQMADYDKKLAALDENSKAMAVQRKQRDAVKAQIEQVDADLQRENQTYNQIDERLRDALVKQKPLTAFAVSVFRRANPESATQLSSATPAPLTQRLEMISMRWVAGGFSLGLLLAFATGAGLTIPRKAPQKNEIFLGGPILGSIPIATPAGRARDADRKAIQQGVAESFRNLRDSLLTHLAPSTPGQPHTLCVTSPQRGDGRSCIAVGLAISLAKAGHRVLLVDADLRSPSLHRIFGVDRSPGLCELIEGKTEPTDALVRTETENLTLLRAGAPSVDAGQLLAWPDLGGYLESLGRRHEHIIIDLGPLLDTPDSHYLVANTLGSILVFPPEARPETVEEAVNLLKQKNANLLGAVRNRG